MNSRAQKVLKSTERNCGRKGRDLLAKEGMDVAILPRGSVMYYLNCGCKERP